MERYVFPNKARAEALLDNLKQLIDWYGVASRADLMDMYGPTPKEVDQKFGWNDLSGASIINEGDEVILCLPRAFRLE